jgi:hypothetical protein
MALRARHPTSQIGGRGLFVLPRGRRVRSDGLRSGLDEHVFTT